MDALYDTATPPKDGKSNHLFSGAFFRVGLKIYWAFKGWMKAWLTLVVAFANLNQICDVRLRLIFSE